MVVYVLVILSSFFLTWLFRYIAVKNSLIDIPNDRSSHKIPTPRGGGIVIAIVWFLLITYYYFEKEIDSTLFFALLCGIPISIISLLDDVFTLSPKLRLLVQVVSAVIALYILGGLSHIDIGVKIIALPILLSILSVLGLIWFINLFNFLDGIDGYISTEVIYIGVAAFIILGVKLPLFLAFATAGFLIWNWQPAKIFMGDVGSTLIGFTIGIFAVYYQNNDTSSIIIWLMISSLFWFDATVTLFRRWRNKEQLSKAHRKHAYQRIVISGYSHQKTVLFSILINLIIVFFVWLSVEYHKYLLVFFGLNIVCLYIIVKMVDKRLPFSKA